MKVIKFILPLCPDCVATGFSTGGLEATAG